jgi:hypothetical protein
LDKISYFKNYSKNHSENHAGKSQRTNTKLVAAREDRGTFNTLLYVTGQITAGEGSGGGWMPMGAMEIISSFGRKICQDCGWVTNWDVC